ncbi:MAG: hypothetical protein NC313_04510 [Butyrivibrio sp.]|nr:hypothetical protein [Butyrivibrio sp.]
MNNKEIIEAFLEFENHSNVLNYHYKYQDMLMWPFVRIYVIDAIVRSNISEEAGYVDSAAQKKGIIKLFSYKWMQLFKIQKNPLFCRKHKDIIFFRSAVGSIKDDTGKYCDIVHDDFIALYDNTAIIEDAPFFRHFYPTKYKAYESDFLDIICMLNEKIARLNRADDVTINEFLNYLRTDLPFKIKEEHWRTLRIILERYAKNNKLIYEYYKRCFMNMQPRIVFVTQGCYGSHAACKIKVLHDLGIPCAEMQHGVVTLSHFAYNFSNVIYTSKEYLEYMPNVFLTFGRYWMNRVRLPIKMEVLGSANFYRNKCKMNEQQAKEILVLPSEDTQAWRDLIAFIGKSFPNKSVIVKIHPLYQMQYKIFEEIENEQNNVKAYINGNIYDYLTRAYVVIGDKTTVLYEAAALEKIVMIWNNAHSMHADSNLGYLFNDKYELIGLLKEISLVKHKCAIETKDIFVDDIKENYLKFIQKYL